MHGSTLSHTRRHSSASAAAHTGSIAGPRGAAHRMSTSPRSPSFTPPTHSSVSNSCDGRHTHARGATVVGHGEAAPAASRDAEGKSHPGLEHAAARGLLLQLALTCTLKYWSTDSSLPASGEGRDGAVCGLDPGKAGRNRRWLQLASELRSPLYSMPHLSLTTTIWPVRLLRKGLGFSIDSAMGTAAARTEWPRLRWHLPLCRRTLWAPLEHRMAAIRAARPDGRADDELRPMIADLSLLSRADGSAKLACGKPSTRTLPRCSALAPPPHPRYSPRAAASGECALRRRDLGCRRSVWPDAVALLPARGPDQNGDRGHSPPHGWASK